MSEVVLWHGEGLQSRAVSGLLPCRVESADSFSVTRGAAVAWLRWAIMV